ncbi:Hypothetical_protein [Hexamita inflata]|uniref:Hypothetical_protein n=1 Tax=Hexamita inflata TaxID=28002 RepID=A0AA86PYB0_9EUKA|nr:Hypothetical protein HINF_LOCUS34002 [Hexamita inflata]CAI9946359.1 Hypothetical protein HINF_LOCUS34004 [Hexamita inflata]
MVYIQISAFCQFSTEMEFDCLKCNFQTNQNHKIDHSSSNAINYRVFKVSLSCAVFCVISSVFAAFNYSFCKAGCSRMREVGCTTWFRSGPRFPGSSCGVSPLVY